MTNVVYFEKNETANKQIQQTRKKRTIFDGAWR